ncbi:unnamed protein product, partial [Sphacelaria rigidula]
RAALAVDFVTWVSLAIGSSAYGKSYLRDTRDPLGLLALQGLTGVVVLVGLERCGILDLKPGRELCTAVRGRTRWAPILHASQALLTNVAVLCGGVAATNALKAMEPVAVVILSYFLLGKKMAGTRLVAIFTIVLGIVVFTSKSGGDTEGGASNVGTSMGTGSGNRGGEGLDVFNVAAAVVGAGLLVSRLLLQASTMSPHVTELSPLSDSDDSSSWLHLAGINAALCFVGHSFASFNLLAFLSPVGHAVGNSCKRILVCASVFIVLGEVMSWRQLAGTSVALCGVVGYNTAGLWREVSLTK